ncbi:MAG: beta-propeller fold lactonase family protein [Deltaproteobacteria bacterium]|nr:beta-propeller fold lactonase family protein [Deltaproteobacteria bacterium]
MFRRRIASLLVVALTACGGGTPAIPDGHGPDPVDAPSAADARPDAPAGPIAASGHAYVAMFLGGILSYAIDPATGALQALPGQTIDAGDQLYAIAADPGGAFVYAVALNAAEVRGYRTQADGSLVPVSDTPPATGDMPTNLTVDPEGRFVFVGHAGEAAIRVYRIDPATGVLTALPAATTATGASFIAVEPGGRFVYASSVEGIRGYALDDATGALTEIEGSPFGATKVFSGAIMIHPGGKFLYNTGGNLNGFAIDPESGALTALPGSPFAADVHGDPSALNLAIAPDGATLFATTNPVDQTFLAYRVDATTGALTAFTGSPFAAGSAPYSIAVDRSGRVAYVGSDNGSIAAFAIDPDAGTAAPVSGSPFAASGLQPEIVITPTI